MRRLPEKAVHERSALDALLDEALVAHVGIVTDGDPVVIPVGYARDADTLLLHGSTGSRLFRALAAGAPACVTVTVLDGLVAARSLFESSMHYRSAVIFGSGAAVTGPAKRRGLDILADRLLPGRCETARPPSRRELAATSLVAIPLAEWSLKVSDQPPLVVEEDEGWEPWTGIVPLRIAAGAPITCEGGPAPADVLAWRR